MAEYSRLASGTVLSAGNDTVVTIPFLPDFIEMSNEDAAINNGGVTRAWWYKNQGQGSAFLTIFGTGDQFIAPIGGTSSGALVNGTGFKTVSAGLSLQYGPIYSFTTGTFTISKAANALVTTSVAHNLVSGNWIIFSNLYQTAVTGMQQIAGIPFMVTVLSPTTFTICWDTTGSNYTAFNSAASLNNAGSFKKILYPALYVPGDSFICDITLGTNTTVTTTAPHNFVVGQEVAFRIPRIAGSPTIWGPTELNSLPNVLIPGSPMYGYVVQVVDSVTVVVNIDSSSFTPFSNNYPFLSFVGATPPQIVAVGDVNTGGWPITIGSDLYPSPLVFDGFGTTARRTINGPAIQGAYINNTWMGFIIGDGIAGIEGDTLQWRAYMHDKNYP